MSGKPSTKDTSSTATPAPAVTAPEATAAPAAVSILGTNVAPQPNKLTPWQKFTICLTACFVAAEPIINAAIDFGMDAAALALKDKINSDPSMSAQQKAALTSVTASSLDAITKSVMAQVAQHAKANANAGNPALTGLVQVAIKTGVVDAFVPQLGLKAESATSETASPQFPITTAGRLKAAVAEVIKGNTSKVLDLSSATGALLLQDDAVEAMVVAAVKSSNLDKVHKDLLLKTGAAVKLFLLQLDTHNESVAKAQLADIAKAVPVVHAVEGDAVVAHADIHPELSAAGIGGVGLAGAAADHVDAVEGHA